MKTTVDIPDTLLNAARKAARRDGTTVSAYIELGLRMALEERSRRRDFTLRDASVAGRGLQPGADGLSWDELRSLAYGHRELAERNPLR